MKSHHFHDLKHEFHQSILKLELSHALKNLLYRIDLTELQIKKACANSPEMHLQEVLAELMIKRIFAKSCIKRIIFQTNMSVIIRKGLPEDIANALHLVKELAAFELAPNEVEVTIEEMIQWGFGSDKLFDFFVAEKNNTIIGMALYYYKYSTWKGKCLFLEDIIVTENERGQGIGKLLFKRSN